MQEHQSACNACTKYCFLLASPFLTDIHLVLHLANKMKLMRIVEGCISVSEKNTQQFIYLIKQGQDCCYQCLCIWVVNPSHRGNIHIIFQDVDDAIPRWYILFTNWLFSSPDMARTFLSLMVVSCNNVSCHFRIIIIPRLLNL